MNLSLFGPLASLFAALIGPFIHALRPFYAVGSTTPDGPSAPAVTTPSLPSGLQSNQFSVSATIFTRGMFSMWMSEGSLVGKCDKRIRSDFVSQPPKGDIISVVKAPRYTLTTGLKYQGQGRQSRTIPVQIGPVRNIHDAIDGATSELYLNDNFEMDNERSKVHRFITGVEEDIATEMAVGYARGVVVLSTTATTWSPGAAGQNLAAAGGTNTNWPNISALSYIGADLTERAINKRERCASLDPITGAALAQTAAANAYFSTAAGQKGWSDGTLMPGSKFAGWKIARSSNQGSVDFTNADTAMTHNSGAAEGTTSLTLNIAAGKGLKRGHKISFANVYSVNEETGAPTSRLAQFTVTADTATTGATKTVNFQPPMYGAAPTAASRWRTCSSLPAANAKVYLFEGDTAQANFRTAIAGKRAARSLLFEDQSTVFVMVPLRLPTRDRESGKRVTSADAGISFNVVEYFVGDDYEYRTRVDGRWGVKVAEEEAGYALLGVQRG